MQPKSPARTAVEAAPPAVSSNSNETATSDWAVPKQQQSGHGAASTAPVAPVQPVEEARPKSTSYADRLRAAPAAPAQVMPNPAAVAVAPPVVAAAPATAPAAVGVSTAQSSGGAQNEGNTNQVRSPFCGLCAQVSCAFLC